MIVTRFAPSPTGDLHLGHAYSAIYAHDFARERAGRFIVRIEDIDRARCRDAFAERHLEDLAWLGLRWEEPVVRQSARMPLYAAALARLEALDVTYPCFCTRGQIRGEVAAAQGAPQAHAADGTSVYPGTCRGLDPARRRALIAAGRPYAVRLDTARALRQTGRLVWHDRARGRQEVDAGRFGDVVIARKDVAASYHLAVVVDDAAQGVSEVTRGEDLFAATHVHRLLYGLLELPPPVWHHHPLCRDAWGRRLAKRDNDTAIRALRQRGLSADDIRALAAATAQASAIAAVGRASAVRGGEPVGLDP
ncbi:MAG: tRNA glutamyl-Q(34) synthetase GluQRS [Rhodospirillales bacterium]|jgi:glutamyl-Q tRNA(Asp) synthetase|nr:tRNA glutamyl-Q(34) synthetase GluQRS [Rhodospirillales bacterium]